MLYQGMLNAASQGASKKEESCTPTATDEREIFRELEIAKIQINMLSGALMHLRDRLEPVMRPEGPQTQADAPSIGPGTNTLVGSQINSISLSVATADDFVRAILDRLELQ